MENLIVVFIVGAAFLWGGLRVLRKRKATSCSSGGCQGCSCPSKSPSPLVTLRR
ncbi:MAG TPA: FeoB-associated Cys-rich membrane protein [Polyangia bacterium]